jgi:GST-like protein
MATFPWLRSYERQGQNLEDFPNLKRWFEAIAARPAVERGVKVLTEAREDRPMSEEEKKVLFGEQQYARR